jgi:hypothetical protein
MNAIKTLSEEGKKRSEYYKETTIEKTCLDVI